MPACTFIYRSFSILALGGALTFTLAARAQDAMPPNGGGSAGGVASPSSAPSVPSGAKKDDTGLFDQTSPYLDYGEFNSSEEEDSDTLFFQYGRFFGLSFGAGYQTATGNRGLLYSAAFPRIDLKLYYWFDFQFAMDLNVFFANHSFTFSNTNYAVKLIGYGLDFKYYFDVRDASAALSFSNPFVVVGIGAMSKSQTSPTSATPDTDSTFTVGLGAGLEFPISYKKTYFIVEGKYNTQSFNDTSETRYKPQVPDLSGGFLSILGELMFCW